MCGIAGLIRYGELDNIKSRSIICRDMIDTLRHRGPDDSGVWVENNEQVVLGHARLAIFDLSTQGHQPMVSSSGRFVISFNGEVYNFEELREELEEKGYLFTSKTDTEVILAGVEHWGLLHTLQRTIGMFALALWDRELGKLSLARDRIGIKPLFICRAGNDMCFASETRAFRLHPSFSGELSPQALTGYLTKGFIPPYLSIFREVRPITPGTILTIDERGEEKEDVFWSLSEIANNGLANPLENGFQEEFESVFNDSVRLRMKSDVPFGAFLSGGIDSSLVVSKMCEISSETINTFTIGFEDTEYNEAPYAKSIAEYLGTNHTQYMFSDSEVQSILTLMPSVYDEPFADASQLPTYLVSKIARDEVTVILSGDGGDELFLGYSKYLRYMKQWEAITSIPRQIRSLLGSFAEVVGSINESILKAAFGEYVPLRVQQFQDYISQGIILLTSSDIADFHINAKVHRFPISDLLKPEMLETPIYQDSMFQFRDNFINCMQYQDILNFLSADILTKVDRASMSVSLEARVPILDHRIVELAWRWPVSSKKRNLGLKLPLRNTLAKKVPSKLFNRPKTGFSIPRSKWLRTVLRNWSEDLLFSETGLYDEYLQADSVQLLWRQFLKGKPKTDSIVWFILSFIAWQRDQVW